MKTEDYLNRLLVKYSNDFDIYTPFCIEGKKYSAYGYFSSHNEKYVLVKEVNMWSSDSYEHIVFCETDRITDREAEEAEALITGYMEREFVRKGEKYPAENHMLSLLTVVLLSKEPVEARVAKRLRKFKFDRGYRMNMRGYSRGRIIAAVMENREIIAGPQAKDMIKLFRNVFDEVEEGQPGFSEICRQQGITPYRQENY